jgi:hypothetical protein
VFVALLSGPAIDGVVPSGKAEFAASQGASLFVDMSSLNLPDFTCLDAAFGRFLVQGISVRSGFASLFVDSSVVPSLTVHPGEVITFSTGAPRWAKPNVEVFWAGLWLWYQQQAPSS